jgi:hypothetical protein
VQEQRLEELRESRRKPMFKNQGDCVRYVATR